ncbi:MAG: DUF2802 domain-containing protein [Gammaproteobacteria bacterium]|nr:DUF2802 domain-containing protein [Gammaproteobacteria bacterium]
MASLDALRLASLFAGLVLLVLAVYLIRLQIAMRARLDALGRTLDAQQYELDTLRQQVRDLGEAAFAAGGRERQLAEQVEQLTQQQEQMLSRDGDTAPYVQAIRSARSGASAESLISAYGLSPGEAELVVALHGPRGRGDA